MAWKNILLVGLGGGAGSIVRFLCQKYISESWPHAFPFGTFLVNIAGCFIIGMLFGIMEKGSMLDPQWRLLLITGFCGGFTTFSSFAAENIQLLKDGQVAYFALYTAGSVVLGILATWFGLALLKWI
jgi:fluoride exporter